jgi:predicted DNA-binding transcriptional regulator YafY
MPGRKQGEYSQAARVIRMLDLLRGRRAPMLLEELATRFEVTPRQVRRDLHALEEAGHPLDASTVDGRSAVRLDQREVAPVRLTLRERFALMSARRVFDVIEGTPFAGDLASVMEKVAATLDTNETDASGPSSSRIAYVPDGGKKSFKRHANVLDELLTGVLRDVVIEATYRSASGNVRRGAFEPWGIAFYRQGLYVVGRWQAEETPRVLALERFASAKRVRGAHFVVPKTFSLESFFQGSFGIWVGGAKTKVEVEFSPAVAHVARARVWHKSQRIAPMKNGGVRVTFEVSDTPELVSWVLAWGNEVTVRAPKELAERVRGARAHR